MQVKQTPYWLTRRGSYAFALFAALLSGCFFNAAFAHPLPKEDKPAEKAWIKDATVQNVTFYHQIVTGNNETVVFLKFENANQKPVTVSWEQDVAITGPAGAEKANSNSVKRQLSIAPGTSVASGTADAGSRNLIIHPAELVPTHATRITDYQFKNPSIQL